MADLKIITPEAVKNGFLSYSTGKSSSGLLLSVIIILVVLSVSLVL